VSGERQARAIRLQEPVYALPMVGRTDELQLINDKLDLALKARGQVIGIVAEAGGRVVGAAAIEPYGADGLLRSVVVAPPLRGTGLGQTLVAAAEVAARDLGVRDLYLLTETAIAWFPRLGYETLPRDGAPVPIATSVEFTVSCPDTGLLMHRRLDVSG
jgi:amino-acid N-acetyltransferase